MLKIVCNSNSRHIFAEKLRKSKRQQTLILIKMIDIINKTNGKFFTVTFVKKDASIRTMTVRTGVKKGVNGNGLKFNPTDRNLKVVWCCDAENFRMINLDTILGIKFKGKNYFNNVI